MSTYRSIAPDHSQAQAQTPSPTYYAQQRELLLSEIAQSLETVLQNINKLNRAVEEVTQVGSEFAPVESLWSHFENVMARDEGGEEEPRGEGGDGEGEEEGEKQQREAEGEGEM